jgi:GNAT superfamily N-acetyltransferase
MTNMCSALNIREAVIADLPTMLELYGQLGMDDGQELDGRPVGTFALLVMDNLGHMGTPSAILEDVVVAESCRGTGIGQQMMAFATDLCRQKGCYKFFFSSNINRTDAHRFYENLGFEKHGYSFYIDLQQEEAI